MSGGSYYNVGVHLAATDGISGVLAAISKSVLKLHGEVAALQKGFAGLNPAIIGAGAALAGHKVAAFAADMAKANGELLRQVNNFKAAGNSAKDAEAAITGAYAATTKVPQYNVAETFKTYRELAGATQDNEGSLKMLPDVMKAKAVIEAATGRAGDTDMQRLFKFIELRQGAIDEKNHKIDPIKFNEELKQATKALVVGQGLITSNDLQQFVKQAGPMAKGLSPEDLFTTYLAGVEDLGGSRTGTALTAAARQVLGGIMTGKVGDKWQEAGLLGDKGWHYDKNHHVKIDNAATAIKGYDTLAKEGFGAFMEKHMMPALDRMGYKTRDDKNKALYEFGSTDTARRLMSLFVSPEQIHLVAERFKKAMGSDAYDKLFDGGDYKSGVKGVHEAMTTLKTALGDAASVSPILQSLAKGIASLADAAKDHPRLATWTTLGGYTIGKSMEIGGVAAIGVAGYRLITAAGALQAAAVSLQAGAAAGVSGAAAATGGGLLASLGAAAVAITPAVVAALVAGGKDQPESEVRARAEMAELTKKIIVLDSLIASGKGNEGTQAKRDAAQARFDELNASTKKAGTEAGKGASDGLKLGFDVNGFKTTGSNAGQQTTGGFLSIGWGSAGAMAAAQVLAGFQGAAKSVVPPAGGGGGGGQKQGNVYIDGKKVGRVMSRQFASAAEHMSAVGPMDSYGHWAGPGAHQTG